MAWSGGSCLQILSYDAMQACIPHLRGPVLVGECGVRHVVCPQQETVPQQVLPCVLQQLSKPTAAHQIRLAKGLQTCKLIKATCNNKTANSAFSPDTAHSVWLSGGL